MPTFAESGAIIGARAGPWGALIGFGVGKIADWTIGGSQATSALRDAFGQLEDEIRVTVSGNHLATKKTLYFTATAVAFGIIKRLVPAGGNFTFVPSPGILGVEYDAAAKEVTVILRYTQNLFTVNVASGASAVGAFLGIGRLVNNTVDSIIAFRGPSDIVVGGAWDFSAKIPGLTKVPDLSDATNFGGFQDKVMLTDRLTVVNPDPSLGKGPGGPVIPTPNPRPIGDARSRGTLTWMVWQSLANPCESLDGLGTQVYTAPNNTNRFSGG